MSFHRTQILFVIFFVVFFFVFHSSNQIQYPYDFPLFDSSHFRNSYFSITRNKKLRQGKIKRVQVYDDMACIQQCFHDSNCVSVDYKKQSTNGLHRCDLLDVNAMKTEDMIDDDKYDHITVKAIVKICKNCLDILMRVNQALSNVYDIVPLESVKEVYCDMVTSGGGWTVIQKRLDGSVDFYRGWDDYKKGFGNKLGDYWLGLDTIHAMTSQGSYRLRIDMEDFDGNTRYAEYDSFYVADEADSYLLTIGPYSGTAGDSLLYHNNMPFSTTDKDHGKTCASKYKAGWWYNSCHKANLNGQYLSGPLSSTLVAKGMSWRAWLGPEYSLKRVEMKIRPKDV